MMNLELIIADKVRNLPPVKQLEILVFIEDLTAEKTNGNQSATETESKPKRYSFIGIGESKHGDISEKAEEILEREINHRSGWSMKDEIID